MTTQSPNKPKRRTYSAEFKALLVKEATDSDRSIASIAREHGINQNLLHNWKHQYQRAANIMSIIQSARLNGLDVSAYLTDVLRRLPTQEDLDELLPHRWVPPQ